MIDPYGTPLARRRQFERRMNRYPSEREAVEAPQFFRGALVAILIMASLYGALVVL